MSIKIRATAFNDLTGEDEELELSDVIAKDLEVNELSTVANPNFTLTDDTYSTSSFSSGTEVRAEWVNGTDVKRFEFWREAEGGAGNLSNLSTEDIIEKGCPIVLQEYEVNPKDKASLEITVGSPNKHRGHVVVALVRQVGEEDEILAWKR